MQVNNEETTTKSIFAQMTNTQDTQNPQENKNSDFSDMLDENSHLYVTEKTKAEEIANMERLVADIDSVMRTGMTEDEIETLERMLEEIQKEMDEKYPDQKKINNMMNELEKMIAQMKKTLSGEIDAEELEEDGSKNSEAKGSLNIETRIANAKEDIKEIKEEFDNAAPKKRTYQSAELLEEIIKFQE